MRGRLGSFASGIAVGVALAASVGAVAQQKPGIPKETLDLLRRVTDVFGLVKQNFAGKLDEGKAVDACLAGFMKAADAEGAYYDEQEFKAMVSGVAARNRAGIGMEISQAGAYVKVVAPLEGTPAERAGILSGDLITRIDDKDTAGLPLNEVQKLLIGPPGSTIRVTLHRAGSAAPVEVSTMREVIRLATVRSSLLPKGVAYMRVSALREETLRRMAEDLQKMTVAHGAPLRGLILDMRNNPGGLLHASIAIAGAFLEADTLVATLEGPTEDSKRRFLANEEGGRRELTDFRAKVPGARTVPLAVLVNGASASGVEILAAALQEHKRAIVIGEKTYGRGSIQTIFPTGASTAVKLTTAYTMTPGGRQLQGQGVTPDLAIADGGAKRPASSFGPADEIVQRAAALFN
jgi:carboxyl-terminal processing protease